MPEVETEIEPRETEPEEMPSMSFLEHLEELRTRIFHSIIAVAAGMGVSWIYRERLFGYMQRPIFDVLRHAGLPEKLVYSTPTEPFNLYLKISALAGLFLTSPYVLYQVWLFISPGLYRREKKYAVPFMLSTICLFVAGGYFGYRMVYPVALDFLVGKMGTQFTPLINIHEYTDLFLEVILGLGLVFEMPILIFFLALMGVVSAGWLWRNVRYAILVIFIIAGVLAPPDVASMVIFATPMLGLYFVSMGVAWFVHPTQREARAARKKA
ncbi:MAG TPA: twin-arginine translocase subunit TatC [Terriglobales bacterium]|nr:twin-arginine translocase subunit TatC [Terriglobales bacterium]